MSVSGEVLLVVLACFVSFILGLVADRIMQKNSEGEKRKQLRTGLKTVINHNDELMGGLSTWVQDPGTTPHFNVDIALLDATSAIKYELLSDVSLCKDVDKLRYELTHLSRKVDVLFSLRFNPIFITQPIGENGKRLGDAHKIDSIGKHISTIKPLIDPLIVKLSK